MQRSRAIKPPIYNQRRLSERPIPAVPNLVSICSLAANLAATFPSSSELGSESNSEYKLYCNIFPGIFRSIKQSEMFFMLSVQKLFEVMAFTGAFIRS